MCVHTSARLPVSTPASKSAFEADGDDVGMVIDLVEQERGGGALVLLRGRGRNNALHDTAPRAI